MDAKKSIENVIYQVKEFLNLNLQDVVGLDVGTSSVKVAELEKIGSSNYRLNKFSIVPLPEGMIVENEVLKIDELVDLIMDALDRVEIDTTFVAIGLGGSNVITRKLQLPGGNKEEIEDQVSWEAEQYLPFPLENATLSFDVVGKNIGGGVDVIIIAAKDEFFEDRKNLIEETGRKVKIVETNMVAVTNIFVHCMESELHKTEDESWLLLDFGASHTSFIIYRNDSIAFTKELNIGGMMITEEIQRQMGLNFIDAEDLKVTTDDSGNLPEEILKIIDTVLENFYSELKKTMDFYISSTSDESLVKIVATGGSSQIPGLLEGVESIFGVESIVLNALDKIEYDTDVEEGGAREIVFQGTTVLGLAMRALEK